MSTVNGTFTTTYLKSFAAAFGDRLAPLASFTLVTPDAGATPGDVIRVAYGTAGSVQTWSDETGFATTGSTVTNKNVTMSNPIYELWNITDTDYTRFSAAGVEAQVERAGLLARRNTNALASNIMNSVWTNVSSSNFVSSSAVSGSDLNTQANFATLQKECDDLKWPDFERTLIANPTLYSYIASNSTGLVASAIGDPNFARTGRVASYMGFSPIFSVNNLPTNGADVLMGFAANPQALAVVIAPFDPQAGHNYNVVSRLVDDQTGIQLTYREWYDPKFGRTNRVITGLAGSAALDPTAALLIKTTP